MSNQINTQEKKYVVIMRGMSGTGKSRFIGDVCFGPLGESFFPNIPVGNKVICSADDYWSENGIPFSYKLLPDAHSECMNKFFNALDDKERLVIVDNTNTRYSEFSLYIKSAIRHGYHVVVFDMNPETVEDAFEAGKRKVHSVPMSKCFAQWERFECFETALSGFEHRMDVTFIKVKDYKPSNDKYGGSVTFVHSDKTVQQIIQGNQGTIQFSL